MVFYKKVTTYKYFFRDPLEVAALLLLDPKIFVTYQNEIRLKHKSKVNRFNQKLYNDINSGDTFRDTEIILQNIRGDNLGHILPLIFYWDGVNVANIGTKSITTVLMTLGIFSNKLIEQDCSKVVISYISNFKRLNIMALSHHLRTICNYNITETKEQIKLFKLMVKNTLWKKINEIINNAWLHGCQMRILGYKDKFIFHPFTILILGDGPAQLEVAGLKLGNANRNCTRCLHHMRNDNNRQLIEETNRNFNDIMNLCNQAEQFIYKKYTQLNQNEKNILNRLKDQGINPFANAFNGMSLGSSTSIFDITPPDTLHTLLAGIVKQLCIWTLIIITIIGRNDTNFRSNLVI